jgi:DNA-binding MarR family transcriptional regulator
VADNELVALDIYGTCVCLGLNRAARAISRRYDAAFKPIGITSGQFTILSALKRDKPVAISDLANRLGMERTTLTRNLRPLEEFGFLVIQPDALDRRIRNLALTPKGRNVLKEAVPLWKKAQKETGRRIGADRWNEIKPALDLLSA